MSSYSEKMSRILPFSQEYAGEYAHYEQTMEAICSRKPERMTPNGMELLRAKLLQLESPALFNSALKAYKTLEEEVNHA